MDFADFAGKNKNLILNIVIIIIAIIIAGNIHKKQNKELEVIRQNRDSEIKKSAVAENISKLEKSIDLYKQLLPEKEANSVISDINNIAKESGIKVASIRPEQEKKYSDYSKIPVMMVMSDVDYHTLAKFISSVEDASSVYVVDSVSVRSRENEQNLEAELKISAVVFADNPEER